MEDLLSENEQDNIAKYDKTIYDSLRNIYEKQIQTNLKRCYKKLLTKKQKEVLVCNIWYSYSIIDKSVCKLIGSTNGKYDIYRYGTNKRLKINLSDRVFEYYMIKICRDIRKEKGYDDIMIYGLIVNPYLYIIKAC